MVLAISITMQTLEVLTVERAAYEDLKVTRSGCKPFSISPSSPLSIAGPVLADTQNGPGVCDN